MADSVADLTAELYALPPGDFTRERNARAAALKKAGRDADAVAVKQLKRPGPALWAVNQLTRAASARLAAFLQSVDKIRRAQLQDPRAAASAVQQQRSDLDALVTRAEGLLAEQGLSATQAVRRRISDTLRGAAVDADRVHDLRAGRLTEELAAPGFEVLLGAPRGGHLRVVPHTSAAVPTRKEDDTRRTQAEQKPELARRLRELAEEDRARRRREADTLAQNAAARQSDAEKARRELDDLLTKVATARERLRAAQHASSTAAAAARKARHAADRPRPRARIRPR